MQVHRIITPMSLIHTSCAQSFSILLPSSGRNRALRTTMTTAMTVTTMMVFSLRLLLWSLPFCHYVTVKRRRHWGTRSTEHGATHVPFEWTERKRGKRKVAIRVRIILYRVSVHRDVVVYLDANDYSFIFRNLTLTRATNVSITIFLSSCPCVVRSSYAYVYYYYARIVCT